jgi:hypothetical protein
MMGRLWRHLLAGLNGYDEVLRISGIFLGVVDWDRSFSAVKEAGRKLATCSLGLC